MHPLSLCRFVVCARVRASAHEPWPQMPKRKRSKNGKEVRTHLFRLRGKVGAKMDEKPSLEFLSPRHWLMDFKMVSRCNSSLDLRGGYGSTAANSPSRGCPSASRYHHVTITCRQVLPRSSYLTLPQSDTPRLRRIPFSSGCSYTSTTGGRRSHLKYSGATHMVFGGSWQRMRDTV